MSRPFVHRLSRRQMLKGVGAALALPWLESLVPTGLAARPPVRLACLFFPNGVWGPSWTPRTEGRDFELSPTLAPLAPVRDRVLVLSGLRNANSLTGEGHYVKTTALLSGAPVKKTGGRDIRCGTSVDQLAAASLGPHTPIPALVLGIDGAHTQVDMGYSTVYGAHVSWRTPTQPAAKEINPRRVFDRLFRTSQWGASPPDRSVLDLVLDEARRLRPRLGHRDRDKVTEYLDSVRALEVRLERFATDRDGGATVDPLERPPERPGSFVEHVDLMLDLIVLAFRTDTTRVTSFMFGNAVSGRDFSFLDGVKGGHHDLSHHEKKKEKVEPYRRINRWHVEKLSDLLTRLAGVTESDGSTLLDNSMVFFGSGIRDGNKHEPHDLPILFCGGGGGRLDSGRHIRFPKHTPLCHLHVTALQGLGLDVDRFGDAEGPLPGLLRPA